MAALCCRAGDSPLVAASRVTLSVQLYAELGALGLVSAMLAVARPHPDERSGLAIAALWLAVATGGLALGARSCSSTTRERLSRLSLRRDAIALWKSSVADGVQWLAARKVSPSSTPLASVLLRGSADLQQNLAH